VRTGWDGVIVETYVVSCVSSCQGLSIYELKCKVVFSMEGGGSSNGAKRVCGNSDHGSDVDIGNLSREWKTKEAVQRGDGYLYDCVIGNNHTAIQIPVAFDGLTVVANYDGAANDCVQILGGLSTDQLRWLYSNYTEDQLQNTGWDPSSIRNSDGDSSTRRWNEIDGRCQSDEIRLSGPGGEVSRGARIVNDDF
jgi:ABC-type phosphate transport system substrate-binding protein